MINRRRCDTKRLWRTLIHRRFFSDVTLGDTRTKERIHFSACESPEGPRTERTVCSLHGVGHAAQFIRVALRTVHLLQRTCTGDRGSERGAILGWMKKVRMCGGGSLEPPFQTPPPLQGSRDGGAQRADGGGWGGGGPEAPQHI